MKRPTTRYTKAGDVSIGYQVVGEGERDLVLALGFAQHLDNQWDVPVNASFLSELASFTRLILFDKRGTGVSDRNVGIPTLEQRMEDIGAAMDAAGSERGILFGVSEAAPTSLLFAATYPERVEALVLFGAMARASWAPDYPWASPADALIDSVKEFLAPTVFTGEDIAIWMPSVGDDEEAMETLGRYRRSTVSPDGLLNLFQMFLDIDVRHVLPAIRVPTLVMHRHGDRVVNHRAGAWLASQIPGAATSSSPARTTSHGERGPRG